MIVLSAYKLFKGGTWLPKLALNSALRLFQFSISDSGILNAPAANCSSLSTSSNSSSVVLVIAIASDFL